VIRDARAGDVPDILAIWNPLIRDTAVTFTSEEKTSEGLGALIAGRQAAGQGVLVAEAEGAVAGFASYGTFRSGPGYAHTVEHTVILAPSARHRGIGRELMLALETHARDAGHHAMIGGVSGENAAAIAFHRALGYRIVGTLPEVGRKFGRWLDLVLMQKLL